MHSGQSYHYPSDSVFDHCCRHIINCMLEVEHNRTELDSKIESGHEESSEKFKHHCLKFNRCIIPRNQGNEKQKSNLRKNCWIFNDEVPSHINGKFFTTFNTTEEILI